MGKTEMSHRKYSYREQHRRDVISMGLTYAKQSSGRVPAFPDTPYHQALRKEVQYEVKLFKSLKKGKVLSELEWYYFKKHYAGFLNEIAEFIGRKPYEKPKKVKKVTTLSDVVKKAKKKKRKKRG